ncbi:hypothetical protein OESDEN_20729 [Oesophagostomum dentatum]|uniref:Uncharacterized protein n=1 Tax=Oesophagostomum dentatum TaxID=61180 RepID=A0A0B1S3X6_OESDE|nr:hypothetical protein OESDEN_20729 [Oesophagostomum dentatum]
MYLFKDNYYSYNNLRTSGHFFRVFHPASCSPSSSTRL